MTHFERIILPLILVLIIWLFFEIIEFFRLGGEGQPLAWCIVKISIISSTIIGLSSGGNGGNGDNNSNLELLLDGLKALSINNGK